MRQIITSIVIAGIGWTLGCRANAPAPAPMAAEQSAKKRNVLLIISDDLCNDLSCYGAPVVSPNVDRLASEGIRFDRMYCQYPLCGPSRCSFVSGLRPDTTGVLQNGLPVRHKIKDLVTLPELFRHNGYTAMRVGKIYHLGIPGQVGQPGPDDPQSWNSTFNPPGAEFTTDGDEYDPNPKNGQSFRRVMGKGEGIEQADYQSASEAMRLLNENKDRPFFLAVGFIRPHVPEIAPKKYFDLYDMSKIKMPKNPPGIRDQVPAAAFHSNLVDFGMDERGCLESIRAYHATTSFMDAQAGRVLDELSRLGLRDNTVVVFMSDHGYLLGQHEAWQKMMLFEEACRVPFIVSYPGMSHRGTSTRAITESVDMYPTVAELCGLKGPKELQGKSLVSVLQNPKSDFKDAAFSQLQRKTGDGHSIRTDRWRYTEWGNSGVLGAELYDHEIDPHEFTNLAKDKAHDDVVRDLKKRLHAIYPATQRMAAAAGGN